MSFGQRHRTIARRLWPLGLLAAVLLAQALAPSGALGASPATPKGGSAPLGRPAAGGTPTQVIDAQADPKAAADALNSGCTDLSKCSWQTSPGSTITFADGPSEIYGDVLYNCATEPGANAYTAVGFTETRSESVSLSESLSLKISLGLLGFEETSAEFTATFGQSSSFSQGVTATNSVEVLPGYKGWTETQVLSGNVTGSAFITDGINLIQVENLGMSFPLPDPAQEDPGGGAQVIYNAFTAPMSADDLMTRCGPINGLGAVRPVALSRSLKFTFCDAAPGSSDPGCKTREVVAGAPLPASVRATAVLDRDGRTYATGTDVNGDIRLTTRRPITAGNYTLTLRERLTPARETRRRTLTILNTIIPIAIR